MDGGMRETLFNKGVMAAPHLQHGFQNHLHSHFFHLLSLPPQSMSIRVIVAFRLPLGVCPIFSSI